jgi:hypothetical protein
VLFRSGRVCLLYMLLALASAVFLGSESLGTRDRILLSQISDFSFRRLLRLAGSRWRYSTPPPHGTSFLMVAGPRYIALARAAQRTPLLLLLRAGLFLPLSNNGRCLKIHYLETAIVLLLFSRSLPVNGSICHTIYLVNSLSGRKIS